MCLYDEMVRVWVFASLVHAWHMHRYLQYQFNLARVRTNAFCNRVSIGKRRPYERHDWSAMNGNGHGGSLTVAPRQAPIGPHMSPIQLRNTITQTRGSVAISICLRKIMTGLQSMHCCIVGSLLFYTMESSR